MEVQPGGALLISGSGPTGNQMDWQAERGLRNLPLRIGLDGARDAAFGTRIGVGPSTDVAVNPDGSFLAARTSIQRFLADGTIDPSFTPWTAANVEILRRLPSGDYLVGGGAFRTFGAESVKSLIRVRANGVRDVSFDYAGTFDVLYDGAGAHRPLGVLSDGRLVVGQTAGGIRRFLTDGSLDPAWTDPAPSVVVNDLVVDAQGKTYLIGNLGAVGALQTVYRLAGDDPGPVDEPPAFTTQPTASTGVTAGGTVRLSVAVTGRPEPVIQWYFDGLPLVGRTGTSLVLEGVQAAQTGMYQAVASNRVAVVRSSVASVHLDPGAARPGSLDVTFAAPALNPPAGEPGFLATTANPVFWGGAAVPDGGLYLWGNFVFRQAAGELQLGVVRLDREGQAAAGFRTGDTIRDAGGGVLLPDGRLVLGAVFLAGGTIGNGVVRLNEDGSLDASFPATRYFEGTVQAAARIVARQGDGGLLVGGSFAKVSGLDRPGLFRLRPDGSLDTAFAVLPLSSQVTTLAIAADGDIYVGGSFSLPGATTEVSLIRLNPDGTRDPGFTPLKTVAGLVALEALPTGGVMGLTAGVAQTVPRVLASLFRLTPGGEVDPGFDAGLPNRIGAALLRRTDGSTLVAGDPASAPGTGSVARHLSGGALDPFYTNAPSISPIRALLPANDGGVWVVSAGLPGPFRLRADDYVPPAPPVIVRAPRSISASGLTAASFRVVADGVRPLGYQWRFNGSPLPGEVADVLTVTPLSPDRLGTYDVVVTGGGQSTVSPPAQLSNLFPPRILVQPLARTNVFVGASVTLVVSVEGSAPLDYQWRLNGSDLVGQNAPTLVLTGLRLDQQGVYTVRVTNAAGEVESGQAEIKVDELPVAPSIFREPEDQVAIAGVGGFCFEPGVSGTGPLGFQWQRNGVDIPGAITGSLCLSAITEAQAGRYRLIVTNAQGRAESREALVTVVPPVFTITREPAGLNLVPDRAAVFMAQVRNDAGRPLTYQWQRNGVDIPGATQDQFRLDPPTLADADAVFRVVVSDGVKTLTSTGAAANARPEVFPCPGGASSLFRLRQGALPIVMSVDARGFGTLSYQWRRGPAQSGRVSPLDSFIPVPGGNTPTLRIAAPGEGDVGDYFCEVRSEFGTSVVEGASQTLAMRVRLVDDDTRPGRVDFGWDYLALGEVWALNGVEFLSDGRVFVAGAFGNPLVGCSPLRLLAKLRADGTIDPSFSPVTASFGTAVGLVRQPSGKLVIAGDFRGIPGLPDPRPGASPGWARFNADGSLDAGFTTEERGFNGSGGIQIAGQSDGRIVILRGSVVHRLLPDGARDASFGAAINSVYSPGIEATADIRRFIVDAADRIVLLTASSVLRFLPNGQPDPAWKGVQVPENLVRMAVGPGGEVVATAYPASTDPDQRSLRVIRFLPDGTRDPAFQAEYPAGGTIPGAPGIQPDGRIVVGGTIGTLSGRLGVDGRRDANWEPMATPGGLTEPAYDPYWFFGPDGRAVSAVFAFDDGIGFATPGQRRLHRIQNGGSRFGQVRLDAPRFVDGRIEFLIPTEPGRNYEVQFLGDLGAAGGVTGGWSTRQTVVGDGTAKAVSLGTAGSVGFYRILARP
jgi:uncharacterized delta-60 repeat protein